MVSKRYIYCLKHPITEEIRYVGKTKNPKNRYKKHLDSYKLVRKGRNKQYVSRWINKLKNQELEPVMKILIECNSLNVDYCETQLISHYKQFCKLTNISGGGEGDTMSEEGKKILSERMKGNKHGVGRKVTEEQKKKLSLSIMGDKNPSRKNMKPVIQYDLNMNIIKEWLSGEDAAKGLRIDPSNINRCLNNKPHYKSAGGFIWKFKKEVKNVL